jgi:hypothetical protein
MAAFLLETDYIWLLRIDSAYPAARKARGCLRLFNASADARKQHAAGGLMQQPNMLFCAFI